MTIGSQYTCMKIIHVVSLTDMQWLVQRIILDMWRKIPLYKPTIQSELSNKVNKSLCQELKLLRRTVGRYPGSELCLTKREIPSGTRSIKYEHIGLYSNHTITMLRRVCDSPNLSDVLHRMSNKKSTEYLNG